MAKKIIKRGLFILLLAVLVASPFYPLPYYISKPGTAQELEPIIEVENGSAGKGSFMLTTVRMGQANIYTFLAGKIHKYYDVLPERSVRRSGESREEYAVRQLHLMDSSKISAIETAFKKAGLPVNYKYKGVYILSVMDNMPAEGKLKPGDRIFQVDDYKFRSADEFIKYVEKKEAGDEIVLKFERMGKYRETAIVLDYFPKENRAGVGIGLVDDKEIDSEPSVKVNTEDIGGPSAGFMFALEIYNQLIDEDLTRGYDIAGTGTISPDGKVGPIGGIEQKVVAAHKAGADIFFAPHDEGEDESNYEAAVKTAKDIGTNMKIVPVTHFDDAVRYLQSLKEKE